MARSCKKSVQLSSGDFVDVAHALLSALLSARDKAEAAFADCRGPRPTVSRFETALLRAAHTSTAALVFADGVDGLRLDCEPGPSDREALERLVVSILTQKDEHTIVLSPGIYIVNQWREANRKHPGDERNAHD